MQSKPYLAGIFELLHRLPTGDKIEFTADEVKQVIAVGNVAYN